MEAYITTAEANTIIGEDVSSEYLEYASDALDSILGRFNDNRLWYHDEEVCIDLKSGIRVYRPDITPIKEITSQTIVDIDGNEIGPYNYKIWCYPDYIRIQRPVRVFDKYQILKLNTVSGYFDKTEVPMIIKQFVAKVGAKLQIEASNAGILINGGTIATGGKSGFRLGDYSVTFSGDGTVENVIKSGGSKNLIELGGGGELDMIYSKYGKVVAGFIY